MKDLTCKETFTGAFSTLFGAEEPPLKNMRLNFLTSAGLISGIPSSNKGSSNLQEECIRAVVEQTHQKIEELELQESIKGKYIILKDVKIITGSREINIGSLILFTDEIVGLTLSGDVEADCQ